MIVNIQPFMVTYTGTKVEIAMPEFQLASTDGYAWAHVMTTEGRIIKSDRVYIPAATWSAWGQDDSVIVNYVLGQLNIIAA
jgi:hypothetical protein